VKILEQAKLFFREGTSDKVYEVDLVEVAPEECVVNFRYGRRGSLLKDGSKTPLPLPFAGAKAVFDKLVASKVAKGYRTGSPPPLPPPSETAPPLLPLGDARTAAILKRIAEGEGSASSWSLERAIWRAADIAVPEAVPLLEKLLGASTKRDYMILAALGRCGGPQALGILRSRFKGPAVDLDDALDRMTILALIRAGGETVRRDMADILLQRLPLTYRELVESGDEDGLTALTKADRSEADVSGMMELLYLADVPAGRAAVLDFLRECPLRPPAFQRVRHIFKAAEYRRDGEVFGLIAYRFETARAMYTRPGYFHKGQFTVTVNGAPVRIHKDSLKGRDSLVAYSTQTRTYLRQRVWRTLRRMGRIDDPDYVRMAVGVLLPFRDRDGAQPFETTRYEWIDRRNYRRVSLWWDRFARYHAFNAILYANSSRYVQKPPAKGWRCREGCKPGDPMPLSREEAFPQLWDLRPEGLLHLISESRCEPVHGFAARALRANRDFTDRLDRDPLVMLLGSPYEVSARLGYELVNRRLSARTLAVDTELVLALAGCLVREARSLAIASIERMRTEFISDDLLWAGLLFSPHGDILDFTGNFLLLTPPSDMTAAAIITRVVARLMALTQPEDAELARTVGRTLVRALEGKLHLIPLDVVRDLLAHPLAPVQELGADILVKHNLPAAGIPDQVLRALLNSDHEAIRAFGVRILAGFSDGELLEREALLASLAMHRLEDIRTAIRPVVKRLADACPEFGGRVAQQLLQILIRSRLGDDLLNDLARLLKAELLPHLLAAGVDGVTVWRLLGVKSAAAQDVGGSLLPALDPETLDIGRMIKLADYDILSVREAARGMIGRSLDRLRADLPNAVKLLDANWDDTREFAFRLFRERFNREDFTPEALVAICDSVKEEVQQFGRSLLTEHFNSDDAPLYLSRLSEHPSESMQLFVTGFVESRAAGNPEALTDLTPFFRDCLTRPNRGRIAKQRILHFLQEEANRSEAAARGIAALLSDISASVSVEISAACIQILLRIGLTYPGIPTPLAIRRPEVRHAV